MKRLAFNRRRLLKGAAVPLVAAISSPSKIVAKSTLHTDFMFASMIPGRETFNRFDVKVWLNGKFVWGCLEADVAKQRVIVLDIPKDTYHIKPVTEIPRRCRSGDVQILFRDDIHRQLYKRRCRVVRAEI